MPLSMISSQEKKTVIAPFCVKTICAAQKMLLFYGTVSGLRAKANL
jgi:hypothetical protein